MPGDEGIEMLRYFKPNTSINFWITVNIFVRQNRYKTYNAAIEIVLGKDGPEWHNDTVSSLKKC